MPWRASASSQAPAAAGTTVRGMPSGMSPPWRSWNQAIEAAAGQRPSPLIVPTCPDAAP